MMMTRSRFFASSCGSAEMPSSSGISISSTATSGLMRSIWLTASRPVRREAETSMSGSAPIQREIMPRITTESSTTMTRSLSCRVEIGGGDLVNATLINSPDPTQAAHLQYNAEGRRAAGITCSEQADFLELRGDDVLVERLHDVLIGTGVQRSRNVCDVVFGGAEHHLGRVAAGHTAQIAEELIAVHDRHVPVEQHRFRHRALADFKRLCAVLGLDDLKVETFEDAARDFSDDARVIDDQTGFHFRPPTTPNPKRDVFIPASVFMPPSGPARFRERD